VCQMNAAQKRKLEWLKKEILLHDGNHREGYEYKRWEVSDEGPFVALLSEVGMVGDEETMASVLCRTRRHIFIGPRGGLKLVNAARYDTRRKRFVYSAPVCGRKVVYWTTL